MQTEELGLDGKNLANMSKAELAMHSDDLGTMSTWQKKKGRKDWVSLSHSCCPPPTSDLSIT